MMQVIAFFLSSVLSCAAVLYAAEEKDVVVTPHGFAYFQIGQIQHITPSEGSGVVPKEWDQQKVNMRVGFDAVIRKNVRIIVGGEAEMQVNIENSSRLRFYECKEAQGIYSWGGEDLSKPFLQFAAGYFPYKYNPDASNLGEYLFRAGAYPQWIISDFANAKMRLMGFRLSSYAIENLSMDLLFTSCYNEAPILDYSLSFLGGYKLFGKLFDLGAGIMLDHLIPVDSANLYPGNHMVIDQNGNYTVKGGHWELDTVTGQKVLVDADTLKYTSRGTKLMVRAALDIKRLLPSDGMLLKIMGKNGLKAYAEVAILGWKDYLPHDSIAYYSDRWKRMPIMFGTNLPTWFLLDLLSVEFEYFNVDKRWKADFPNKSNPSVPDNYPIGASRTMWKWSVYAEKELVKGFSLLGLVARDHYRWLDIGGNFFSKETMNGPGDWHYNVRLMFSF